MPMWRCPHCGTPQPEAARCWVCRRSSTCCATCRHFRHAVAAGLGYCGLERGRRPLHGSEIRSCWDPVPGAIAEADDVLPVAFAEPGDTPAMPGSPSRMGTDVRNRRVFVPVATSGEPSTDRPGTGLDDASHPPTEIAAVGPSSSEPRWSLFPELDR